MLNIKYHCNKCSSQNNKWQNIDNYLRASSLSFNTVPTAGKTKLVVWYRRTLHKVRVFQSFLTEGAFQGGCRRGGSLDSFCARLGEAITVWSGKIATRIGFSRCNSRWRDMSGTWWSSTTSRTWKLKYWWDLFVVSWNTNIHYMLR